MTTLPGRLQTILRDFARGGEGSLVVLTGAGISAESGIPTFRGKEGYWVIGSREHMPEEMATFAMFSQRPDEVWAWYLYRRGVCHLAEPNAGHHAVVKLEQRLGDRFLLITQNVDGLHLRAGSSPERTYQIHGNIDFMRCATECGAPISPLPGLSPKPKGEGLTDEERAALRCPACGGLGRPHVLWFDEYYDEEHFRFHSSLRAAVGATVLLVVGTSGATNLPMQVGQAALEAGATIVDINPEPNPFSSLASRADRGFFLQGGGGLYLPLIAEAIAGREVGEPLDRG
jgi:NAD-dependent deacetylase